MSSAAVQPQSSPSPQQYAQNAAAAAVSRDRYSTAASTSAPSAASARRPVSSRPGTDNAAYTSTPPQQYQYSSRGQPSPSTGVNSAAYSQYYPDQQQTSAMSPSTMASRTASQQASPQDARAYAARTQTQGGDSMDSERERAARAQRSPRDEQAGSARSQRTRNAPTSSRSATAIGQPPMGSDLPRENSAVINRIVVDDPQADLIREEVRKAEGRPHPPGTQAPAITAIAVPDQPTPGTRTRQEHLRQQPTNRKEVKFGDYFLGQTLGEGEFGKVKMGWKKDSTVQVAIKLIRKESLAGNATRLPKIYREISILRELHHPNIVRLHEFVETERHMGIILEYASGGELFEYILNHRYLKDPAARRLFAQLVSGVGYLHKKGIVHRDLKLENLLLDRNKHIIITDFGFANTFDPNDELGEEVEARISDKDFIKREGLDRIVSRRDGGEGGHRRGDLMQTSCGSPCYAAPELVVSDGLYTGRKVDVWSCGVILYAMLAGYLPFDDDPANPEGDNINLLYKYIVSTPLTFPEYVTPHARDLLRRILVPDPRRRADLFEVARHSWLSEYTHVVGFIGSRGKSDMDIVATAMQTEEELQLGRSASVREPATKSPTSAKPAVAVPRHTPSASVGGDQAGNSQDWQQRDAKRRTVQVEYVAPNMATVRGEPSAVAAQPMGGAQSGKTRMRPEGGPTEVLPAQQGIRKPDSTMAPPSRPGREQRTTSDSVDALGTSAGTTGSRPATSGTLGGASRLPSRGNSYSQPAAATPTTTLAQGSFSQPKSGPSYFRPNSGIIEAGFDAANRPASQQQAMTPRQPYTTGKPSGHKRSTTLGTLADRVLSRSNSKRQSQQETAAPSSEKRDRRFPPISMKNAMPAGGEDAAPRMSTESRRTSFGFARKASKERDSSVQGRRTSRRFSFLTGNFSFTGKKDPGYESEADDGRARTGRPESKGMAFGRGASPSPDNGTDSTVPLYYERQRDNGRGQQHSAGAAQQASRFDKAFPPAPIDTRPGTSQRRPPQSSATGFPPRNQYRDDGYGSNRLRDTEPVERFYTPDQEVPSTGLPSRPVTEPYASAVESQFNQDGQFDAQQQLRPQQRRFDDAYQHGHSGSSSATRRVMDFFRRRGKDRAET